MKNAFVLKQQKHLLDVQASDTLKKTQFQRLALLSFPDWSAFVATSNSIQEGTIYLEV